MKALSALDALFLHLETPATPMQVGALHRLKPPRARGDFLERIRRHVGSRLHLAAPFTRRLATLPLQFADPVWVEADSIDLEWHIRRVRLPRPGSHAQLEALAAKLHAQPLDRSRPLWRMALIEGLASGELALLTQFHHATLDGAAGVLLAQALLDTGPRPRPAPAPPPRSPATPGSWRLARAGLAANARKTARLARRLPHLLGAIGAAAVALSAQRQRAAQAAKFSLAPHTRFNVAIRAPRRVATLSLPLDDMKAMAHASEATLNDVVLAVIAGGLRHYLGAGLPAQPLVAAVPMSLRAAGDQAFSTRVTMTLASLATNIDDPLERLATIRGSTGAAKSIAGSLRGLLPTDAPSFGLPWLLPAGAAIYGAARLGDHLPTLANLVVSNVPGPPAPLWLAGARLLSWWPLSIVEHGLGLNITVQSYAGAVDFGLVSAKNALPDPARLARGIAQAYQELLAAIELRETDKT